MRGKAKAIISIILILSTFSSNLIVITEGDQPTYKVENDTRQEKRIGLWSDNFENDTKVNYMENVTIGDGAAKISKDDYGESRVGLWHLDDGVGNTAEDSSDNGNHGTLQNMDNSDWVAGHEGGALKFDGVDDYIEVSDSPGLDITDSLTIELWSKILCCGRGGVSKLPLSAPYNGYLLKFSYNYGGTLNDVQFSTDGDDLNAPNLLTMDNWHQITAVYDHAGGTKKIYLNGIEVASKAYSGGITANGLDLWIGRSEGDTYHSGLLDEVAIYNRSLSSDEVYARFTNTARYHPNAVLRSETIDISPDHRWSLFFLNRSVPANTYLNISLRDAVTGEALVTDNGGTDESLHSVTNIDPLEHSSVYIEADFTSDLWTTPALVHLHVQWEPIELPVLFNETPDVEILEDTPIINILDLSDHFSDEYSHRSPSAYSLEYISDTENVTLRLNGSELDVTSLADNWTGVVSVIANCTNMYGYSTSTNMFNISVLNADDPPVWTSRPPTMTMNEDENHTTNYSLFDHLFDAENDVLELSASSDSENITVNVSEEGRITIIPEENYFGNVIIEVTAYEILDGSMKTTVEIPLTIKPVNDAPTITLLSPANGTVFNKNSALFHWSASDIDSPVENLTYHLSYVPMYQLQYLFESSAFKGFKGTNLRLVDEFDYNTTYYWAVIVWDGDGGETVSPTWSFTIGVEGNGMPGDEDNESISIEVYPDNLKVKQGEEATFSINATNYGDVAVIITVSPDNEFESHLFLVKPITIPANSEMSEICTISGTDELQPGNYTINLTVVYSEGIINLNFELQVLPADTVGDDNDISDDVEDDDTHKTPDKSSKSNLLLIVLGVLVSIILAVIVIAAILRKKKKKKEDGGEICIQFKQDVNESKVNEI